MVKHATDKGFLKVDKFQSHQFKAIMTDSTYLDFWRATTGPSGILTLEVSGRKFFDLKRMVTKDSILQQFRMGVILG